MISYEDIKKVNDAVSSIDVKGKPYMEVNQRIKAFRMLYPAGSIRTEILSNEGGVCIIKATVGYTDESGDFLILGTGTAYEKEGSTFINKTSYIENCETSAVGRALGMAGLGIDTSVASAEEVQNAIANQGKKTEKVDVDRWIAAIDAECKRTGLKKENVFKQMNIKSDNDLDYNLFKTIMDKFEKTPSKA